MHFLISTPQRLDSGATPTFAGITGSNGQTITGNSSGAWAIAANGTNQSITLTPSGSTGAVVSAVNGQWLKILSRTGSACVFGYSDTGTTVRWKIDDDGSLFIIGSVVGIPLTFVTNNTERGRFSPAGNFLTGGLTTDLGAPACIYQATLGSAARITTSAATNDDPTEIVYQNRVATTDATVTTLHTIAIPATTTVKISASVVARRTGGAAGTAEDGATYERVAAVKNVAGTATIIGAVATPTTIEDQAGWDCTITVSGGNALLRVTGAVDNNITWHATIYVEAVSS